MGHASGVCRSDRRTQNRELKKSDQEERPPAASTALHIARPGINHRRTKQWENRSGACFKAHFKINKHSESE